MNIRRLTPMNTAEYRALMLEAYASEPEAFTATVAEREQCSMHWWRARVSERADSPQLVYGAFAQGRLVGVAGLRFEQRPRTRHKASLFGMYVKPDFRRRGFGRMLVDAVIAHAEASPDIRILQLTVTVSNECAIALYESRGFATFGVEPEANRVGDDFLSKAHMWRLLDSGLRRK